MRFIIGCDCGNSVRLRFENETMLALPSILYKNDFLMQGAAYNEKGRMDTCRIRCLRCKQWFTFDLKEGLSSDIYE